MMSAESLRALFRTAPAVEGPVAGPPGPRFVVVACMDRRVQPEACLGLSVGGARVIRNAGGRVSDDALRSLIVAWSELGAEEFVVIHHTDCVVGNHTNEELQRAVKTASGADAARLDFLAFADPRRSVWDDVERIRNCEFIPTDLAVVGFVYDLDTGRLELVAGDPLSQLPFAREAPAPPRRDRARGPKPVRQPSPPSGLGELAELAQLPPPPVPGPAPSITQPALFETGAPGPPLTPATSRTTSAPRLPAGLPRARRAFTTVVGILIGLGFLIAGIANQDNNNQSSTDVTVPTLDLTIPTVAPVPTTAAPVPTSVAPVAAPAVGPVVYQDPLAGPSRGFSAERGDKNGHAQFVAGGLQIFAANFYYDTQVPGDLTTLTGHQQEPTIDLEVTAAKVSGSNGGYGIGCRLSSDATSGYYLLINGDRTAQIIRQIPGSDDRVLASSQAPTDVINPGTTPNVVRGRCTGAAGQPVHLTLIVNGRTLLDATDTRQPRDPNGTVGIIVDTGAPNADGSGTTAAFTNFTLRTS